jgi:hypothetical protein
MLKLPITIFSLTFILTSCSLLGDGSDTVIKKSINGLHGKKAILFLREAGATVSDFYQVTVIFTVRRLTRPKLAIRELSFKKNYY